MNLSLVETRTSTCTRLRTLIGKCASRHRGIKSAIRGGTVRAPRNGSWRAPQRINTGTQGGK